MFGQGLVKGLGVTFKHQVGGKITREYPEVRPDLAPRFRGRLEYEMTVCIACGICTQVCPNRVLSLESAKWPDGKKRPTGFHIDLQYCLFCNLCVENCPTKALDWSPDFELACFAREQTRQAYLQEVPAVANAEPAAAAEQDAIAREEEKLKKLAVQVSQLKKEAGDLSLSEKERALRREKAEKIAATVAKLAREVKERKNQAAGGESDA